MRRFLIALSVAGFIGASLAAAGGLALRFAPELLLPVDPTGGVEALLEAARSGLPGTTNGPADAYRHVLGSAEVARRLGPRLAALILEATERVENLLYHQWPVSEAMDRTNNAIGMAIGTRVRSAEEARASVRAAINAAWVQGGSGAGGTPVWLARAHWRGALDDRPLPAWLRGGAEAGESGRPSSGPG
ncbi:MAG: hypothetical protein IT557_14785 [Alphaproteobacteria bacterium]|nr:hypothetical protein [Alphaproteobacteria bacterium]